MPSLETLSLARCLEYGIKCSSQILVRHAVLQPFELLEQICPEAESSIVPYYRPPCRAYMHHSSSKPRLGAYSLRFDQRRSINHRLTSKTTTKINLGAQYSMAAAHESPSESESDDSWFSDPEEVLIFRQVPWLWGAELATLDQVGEVVKDLKVPRKKIRLPVKKVAEDSSDSDVPPTYLYSDAESSDSSQTSSSSNRPLPKKQRRKDGTWEYLHYVPLWTDPEWSDKHEIVPGEPDPDGGPPGPTMRFDRMKGDMYYNLRPALLAKDALQNPTEFAKRWGIARGRTDGRSGLSPMSAMARRILLSKPMNTPDGKLKDHLNIDDLRASQTQFLQANLAQQGVTFPGFLQSAAQSHDERGEQAQGLLALLNILQADMDYQRGLFLGFSTDEVCGDSCQFCPSDPKPCLRIRNEPTATTKH